MRLVQLPSADHIALSALIELALGYPHPHNVFGHPRAADYVCHLAAQANGAWHCLFSEQCLRVAAHLSLYCDGDNRAHSLWKIRHPLLGATSRASHLAQLFDELIIRTTHCRPGSTKTVLFLSEHERLAARAARLASFLLEGTLRDFYRLGENCLIYGRTAVAKP